MALDMTGQVTRLGLVSSVDAQMDPMLVEEPRQKIFVYSFLLFCRPGVPLCVESNEVVGNEAAARVHDVAVGLLLPRHEGGGCLLRVDCGDI